MSEITALRKHPCPECGGDAEWNAAKQALACPFCGTVLPFTEGTATEGEVIKEHDLIDALQNVPAEDRGWQDNPCTLTRVGMRMLKMTPLILHGNPELVDETNTQSVCSSCYKRPRGSQPHLRSPPW